MTGRKAELMSKLADVRQRTLWLLEEVPDDMLRVRIHSFYSPIGWHFGHVGRTEEYWACTEALGRRPLDEHLSFLLADTPENPKDNRVNIPNREGLMGYMAATRKEAISALEDADLESENPLLRDGYAWEFAFQHECQHQETITEMMMLIQMHRGPDVPWQEGERPDWIPAVQEAFVTIPAGTFSMGTDDPLTYDNEQRAHLVDVPSFEIQSWPVTCYQWFEFIEAGGYRRQEFWSEAGWDWRNENEAVRPFYWLGTEQPTSYSPLGKRHLLPDEPVFGISWFEAEAFTRWRGLRLPTEAEWEYAARGAESRTYPWGEEPPNSRRASFGLQRWRPATPNEVSEGANAAGVLGLAGGAWEWTATDFLPYPGFEAFPYEGYSKDHMRGLHKSCRGGSWASQPAILRSSFRNWYVPTYRQGFLGLRCAR